MAMTLKLKEYYARMKIDGRNMESLLSEQAAQHGEICREYVLLKSQRDRLEVHIEQEFNRLAIKMRGKLARDHGKAPTEAQVKQAVGALSGMQELKEEWLDLKEETRHWDLLREPSQQRSFMIGHLVELHVKQMLSSGSSRDKQYEDYRSKSAEARSRRSKG